MLKKRPAITVLLLSVLLSMAPMGAALGIEYTEDLIEITGEGAFDATGAPVELAPQVSAPEAPAAVLPEAAPKEPDLTGIRADSFEEYQQTIINNWGGARAYSEQRLKSIQENLESELKRFETVSRDIETSETRLEPLRAEVKTLTDQVNLFNEQLRFTREKISGVEKQIAERQVDMAGVMKETEEQKIALREQELIVLDYIALLYDEESQYLDWYADGASTLKLLLADNTVSENLLGREYVSIMEQTGRRVFHDLEERYLALQEKKATLLLSQTKLNRLYASLDREKQVLEETRESKKELLAKSQEQADAYEKLLEESIQQQLESALAIQNMKDNIGLIESKLALLDDKLEAETAIPEGADAAPEIPLPGNKAGQAFFDWPVDPKAITAYFHDPDYPKKWGAHQAVDIRAPQFTEVRAPANGYVVEAKDNGFGYSYIILAHKKNLVTVYGHVTEILVKPGTLVQKGEVIALSGGTPGTRGAGLQTTGPHLHFEVHFKGEPQNPLDYLPVHELPIEYVPEEYLKR